MRDAFGGIVNIGLIIFFIVVVFSYLAFNVNYTKAFRMRDKIIAIYNQYNGKCRSACKHEIREYAKKIGYKPSITLNCAGTGEDVVKGENDMNLYCFREIRVTGPVGEGEYDDRNKYHYEIRTVINVDVPIIKNIFGYENFQIKGFTNNFDK